MIRELKQSEIVGLNSLPPTDWKFDFETFLNSFITDDFFDAFVMTHNKTVIGIGNVFCKGKIGWLANIIIAKKYRGKGFGLKMTQFLVDFLNTKGCETQLLLATELGKSVYQKAGFKKITDYYCFDTEKDYDFSSSKSIRELKASDLKDVYEMDMYVNGENRTHLMEKSCKDGLGYFDSENELLGFYLPDFGRGLIISKDKQAGIDLLKLKHSKKGQRTLLPLENQEGIALFEKQGLKKGDTCFRMILGKENRWKPNYIYSYGSGYCG